jgi:hypothetical protein
MIKTYANRGRYAKRRGVIVTSILAKGRVERQRFHPATFRIRRQDRR